VVTVPAFVWRGGRVRRALTIGGAVGLSLGALAWIDSGVWFTGVIVLVVLAVFYGIWMSRRMARYWPTAGQLDGPDRERVARTVRRGDPIGHERLAQPGIDYARGMRAAVEDARPFRWVVPLVLVVSVATAVWDSVFGSWGNLVASCIYLVLFFFEIFWWPKRRDRLLANADRAADIAQQMLDEPKTP